MHAQKEIFLLFLRERTKEHFSFAEISYQFSMKKMPLINTESKKSPVHIYKRLHYLLRVAIPFNDITNVDPMTCTVNSLNISNLSCVNMAENYIYLERIMAP